MAPDCNVRAAAQARRFGAFSVRAAAGAFRGVAGPRIVRRPPDGRPPDPAHPMLYPLIRPFLFQLDAERAHETGIGVARFLANHPGLAEFVHDSLARPALLPRRVAGLTFPNPVGLAAGLDKNAEAALAWWAFGFGFVELGTVTPRPQAGKPRPRLFRDVPRRALVNRMGFNNQGADAVA